MSLIPKARKIEIDDPPAISSIELIKQVIENINAQISSLDQEIASASQADATVSNPQFSLTSPLSMSLPWSLFIVDDIGQSFI